MAARTKKADEGVKDSPYTVTIKEPKLPENEIYITKTFNTPIGNMSMVFDSKTHGRVENYFQSLCISRGIPEPDNVTQASEAGIYYISQGYPAKDALRLATAYYNAERQQARQDAFVAAVFYYTKVNGPAPVIEPEDPEEREEAGLPPELVRRVENPIERKLAILADLTSKDPTFAMHIRVALNDGLSDLMSKGLLGDAESVDEDGFRPDSTDGDLQAADDAADGK